MQEKIASIQAKYSSGKYDREKKHKFVPNLLRIDVASDRGSQPRHKLNF
jgi:hypothetical protein